MSQFSPMEIVAGKVVERDYLVERLKEILSIMETSEGSPEDCRIRNHKRVIQLLHGALRRVKEESSE